MEKVKTYLIKWYGPFKTRQLMKKWEESRPEKFKLYVFHAKPKNKKDRYYCGMTTRSVWERMNDYNHHIHEFENKKSVSLQIWIGTIANKRASDRDVRICENLITSQLAYIGVGEKYLENSTNKKPPVNDVYIFNEWLRDDKDYMLKRQRNSVPAIIPEAMVYYSETKYLFGVNHLKSFGVLI